MQSKAATVDDYLTEVPPSRLGAMIRLRDLFQQELKGYEEKMAYGSPGYAKSGVVEAGFASQKQFIAVYILKQDAFNQYINELKGVSSGKGVIRFSRPEQIDFDVLRKMLRGTYLSGTAICGPRQG
jgi:uncharacterized protein YdhG (YjbR/CyaY superfamily)